MKQLCMKNIYHNQAQITMDRKSTLKILKQEKCIQSKISIEVLKNKYKICCSAFCYNVRTISWL